MCRFVVYVGKETQLANVITRPKHSLISMCLEHFFPHLEQEMGNNWTLCSLLSHIERNIPVNGDGFGVGWYESVTNPCEPCVFTDTSPPWSSRNLQRICDHMKSGLIFGHIRGATSGLPVVETNCHPFQFGKIMFMHNGSIPRFCIRQRLFRSLLSNPSYTRLEGVTDSEILGALFIDILHHQIPLSKIDLKVGFSESTWSGKLKNSYTTEELVDSIHTLISLTCLIMEQAAQTDGDSTSASLNIAITDGVTTFVSRFRNSSLEESPPTLYYRCGETPFADLQRPLPCHRLHALATEGGEGNDDAFGRRRSASEGPHRIPVAFSPFEPVSPSPERRGEGTKQG
eukprot:GCRY01007105.1.p1 GENE.GCRY01007105.1~~GCRY01007105.1.p1  ORF type:complete len:343 (+),score=45.31 GCRY01007105.1:202-1230(+)